jgi:O-antigen ligase
MLTLVIALGVIVTFSRGAALGFTIALVVAALLRYIRARDLAVVAIAGVLLVGSLPGYVERLATVEGLSAAAAAEGGQGEADDSFRKRVNSTLAAALMFVEHPVLGVGPGQVPRHYLEYAGRVAGLPEARAFEAHNLYVGVAAESGVLGLLVFVAILLLAVRRLAAVRRRWGPNAEIGAYATGFILAIFVYMATGLFLHLAYQRYFWLLIALAAATATLGMDDDGLESRNDSGRAPQGRLPQAAVVT